MQTIYLDNNSTTRPAPEVISAMQRVLGENYGNPSSMHRMGQAARNAVEQAREQVAVLIGAQPREIVFTSGGTEADNLALRGTLAAYPGKRRIVTTAVEHPAVLTLCEQLGAQGYDVVFVGVDVRGNLDLDQFAAALDGNTALATVMHANNETGVIFPIAEIAAIAHAKGVPLHVDAVQSLGKIPWTAAELSADLISISAHKLHGPKGVGALYVGRGARLRGVQVGGHQERDIRPGTENAPGVAGFGAAADLAGSRLKNGLEKVRAMRDRLEASILREVDFARVIGDREKRILNTTMIGFAGVEAEALLIALSEAGVCASAGAACSSGSLEPSHVLKAMGIEAETAKGAVRFSLSAYTTDGELDEVLPVIVQAVRRLAATTA